MPFNHEASTPKNLPKFLSINGHGGKTQHTFVLRNGLVCPGDLNHGFTMSIPKDYQVEQDTLKGELKPIEGGQWYHYPQGQAVGDIDIRPWDANLLQTFATQMLDNHRLWSELDNQAGPYLSRDAHCVLIVRKEDGSPSYLAPDQAQSAFEKIQSQTWDKKVDGSPICFFAASIGKIKILDRTRLSEVIKIMGALVDPSTQFVCLTCNSDPRFTEHVYRLDSTQSNVPIQTIIEANAHRVSAQAGAHTPLNRIYPNLPEAPHSLRGELSRLPSGMTKPTNENVIFIRGKGIRVTKTFQVNHYTLLTPNPLDERFSVALEQEQYDNIVKQNHQQCLLPTLVNSSWYAHYPQQLTNDVLLEPSLGTQQLIRQILSAPAPWLVEQEGEGCYLDEDPDCRLFVIDHGQVKALPVEEVKLFLQHYSSDPSSYVDVKPVLFWAPKAQRIELLSPYFLSELSDLLEFELKFKYLVSFASTNATVQHSADTNILLKQDEVTPISTLLLNDLNSKLSAQNISSAIAQNQVSEVLSAVCAAKGGCNVPILHGPVLKPTANTVLSTVINTLLKHNAQETMRFDKEGQCHILLNRSSCRLKSLLKYIDLRSYEGSSDTQMYEEFLKTSRFKPMRHQPNGSYQRLTSREDFKDQKASPLTYGHMAAINIYTQDYIDGMAPFALINYLLRTRTFSQGVRGDSPEMRREIIIHFGMLASALSQLPDIKLDATYRAESALPSMVYEGRSRSFANETDYVKEDGFISTSLYNPDASLKADDTYFITLFHNVSGKLIAGFSCYPREHEILLLPTQIKYDWVCQEQHVHYYVGHQVESPSDHYNVADTLKSINPLADVDQPKLYEDFIKPLLTLLDERLAIKVASVAEDFLSELRNKLNECSVNTDKDDYLAVMKEVIATCFEKFPSDPFIQPLSKFLFSHSLYAEYDVKLTLLYLSKAQTYDDFFKVAVPACILAKGHSTPKRYLKNAKGFFLSDVEIDERLAFFQQKGAIDPIQLYHPDMYVEHLTENFIKLRNRDSQIVERDLQAVIAYCSDPSVFKQEHFPIFLSLYLKGFPLEQRYQHLCKPCCGQSLLEVLCQDEHALHESHSCIQDLVSRADYKKFEKLFYPTYLTHISYDDFVRCLDAYGADELKCLLAQQTLQNKTLKESLKNQPEKMSFILKKIESAQKSSEPQVVFEVETEEEQAHPSEPGHRGLFFSVSKSNTSPSPDSEPKLRASLKR